MPPYEVDAPLREILDPPLDCNPYRFGSKTLADLGGRARRTPPPTGPDSFVSTYKIFETYPPWESTPPLRGPRPPYGKSWICHCKSKYKPTDSVRDKMTVQDSCDFVRAPVNLHRGQVHMISAHEIANLESACAWKLCNLKGSL